MGNRFGMVYGKSYTPYQSGDTITKMDFAKTIVLDEPVTDENVGGITYGDASLASIVNFHLELTPYYCKLYRDADPMYTKTLFEYTSDDGINYTRITELDTFTLGIGDDYSWTAEYNSTMANFVRVGKYEFKGVYEWIQDTTKLPLYEYPTLQEDGTFVADIIKNDSNLDEPLNILINNVMPTMNIRTSMSYVPFIIVRKSDTIYQFHYYCTKALSETDRYIYNTNILYDNNGYHIGGYASGYSSAGWHYVEVNTQTKTFSHNTCSHTEGYNVNFHYGYTLLETDMWTSIQINQSTKTADKVSVKFYNLTTPSTPTLSYGKKWGVAETQFTATSSDIAFNKTAYGKDGIIIGALKEILAEEANAAGNETMSNIAKVPLIKEVYTNDAGEMFVRIDYVKDTVQRAGSMLMVDAPTLATVIGLTADKIKAGETILGITGTYTGQSTGGDTTIDLPEDDL